MSNPEGHLPESTRFAQDMRLHIEEKSVARSPQSIEEFEQTMEERAESRKHVERTLGKTTLLRNELEGEHDG